MMGNASQSDGLWGHAYEARSSFRQPARLVTRQDGDSLWCELLSEDQTLLANGYLSELLVDAPLGSAPRKLTFIDGTVFETTECEAMDALVGKTYGARLHHYEGFNPRLFGVVVVCLFAAWGLWRYGLALMVAAAIFVTPPVVIEQIDAGTMQSIDFIMAEPSRLSDAQKASVERVYTQLVQSLPQSVQDKHSFKLLFRDIPGMGPNAFALPGGTMVMTDAFVNDFPDVNVLAGVLGHEMGHVVEQHGLKRIYRSFSTYILVSLLAGDVGPILEDIVLEGNVLLSLSFSREQETSADKFGLSLSNASGFNPRGLKQFFIELDEEYGDQEPPQWTSTHPSNAARIKAIDAYIDGLQAQSPQ